MNRKLIILVLVTMCLAYGVVVLGAYVRLSDAGLGCPDWPGCYGRLVVPGDSQQIAEANSAFSQRPVEPGKAWKEMIHRYFASTLGLCIFAVSVLTWRAHRTNAQVPRAAPLALVPLVVFQGLLGMWTVTLLLKPLVVSSHLLGGLTVLALLWWTVLRLIWPEPARTTTRVSRLLANTALAVLILQIALGGWTSANYAALACTDFPRCHGSWWPAMDFADAFVLWRGLGIDYEFGVLDAPARIAVHYSHRIGALAATLLIGWLGITAIKSTERRLVMCGTVMLAALLVQIVLGISNVHYGLPLKVAVSHNAVAAVLLLSVIALLFFNRRTAR